MRISIAGLLFALAVALGFANASLAEEQFVTLRGGIWAIVPPPGFVVLSEPVAGLKHPSGAFILIQDTPKGPVSRSFFDIPPAQQAQVRVDEVSEVTVNGKNGFLGALYVRKDRATNIILILEGETSNAMIIAILPDKAAGTVPATAIREALLTAVEQPKDINDRLADLPYVIGDMAGMHVATYAAGIAVLLTDGPSDDMEEAAEQVFAQLASLKNPSGQPLDKDMPMGPVRDRVLKKFPDARILTSGIIDTPQGNVLEVRYERTTTASKPVAGIMWLKLIDDLMVVMICQHPPGDDEAVTKLETIRAGLRAK